MGLFDFLNDRFNDKEVRKIMVTVKEVESYDAEYSALSDEALKGKTNEFKKRLSGGETLDDILPEAFATVREAAVRTLGMKHYPVQIVGGIVLHQGRIAEMKTGEGKTLMATLPVYLNALSGEGVHVITVNDYLAFRDKEWMGKLYEFLGLSVGCVIHGVAGQDRKDAYLSDITYGTNNEFGFDYLRDNMVIENSKLTQRPLNFAIVDEVDSILIDEARTPLIISGEGAKSTELYSIADMFVSTLKRDVDFDLDEKARTVILTDEGGIPKAEKFFNIENLGDPEHMEKSHHINQALRARHMMKRDVDYVIKDGEIVIVDSFTGRLMFGRRYSNGLHQAIEAKERIEVRKESQTLATITLQNYFRMYNKISGMTGTAKTEEDEFQHIYGMDVVVIPTNKPIARIDKPDVIFKSIEGKFAAIIEDIKEKHETGQPVLVGTISIETSEYLSKLLKRQGIKHEVLNAKQHEREADIVAQAGRFGAVTIATNMAGRGTDIVLGGNADYMSQRDLGKMGYEIDVINKAISPLDYDDELILECREKYKIALAAHKEVTDEEAERVKNAGGLHIIGTERHESRRIDNQLRGRSGRQGDEGSSQFFISFEDDLMRLFVSDRAKDTVARLGISDDMPIEAKMLTRAIEGAQKKVEVKNFGIRKHVLQYDDVMNKQRSIIYAERAKVLHGEDVKEHILDMLEKRIDDAIDMHCSGNDYPEEWDLKALEEYLHQVFLPMNSLVYPDIQSLTKEKLKEDIHKIALDKYEAKEKEVTPDRMRDFERFILLKIVDRAWMDHIDAMDQLKQGVSMRGIGQEDPVRAYQMEGFDMFDEMIRDIQMDTVKYVLNVTIETKTTRENKIRITSESNKAAPVNKTVVRKQKKVGRNEPCPCGSGKKYKKCCGINEG
ncbi:preprotein translocase subunit SecA [Acidaminobacter sp. JC074]|uniref:preprotein translocase subunit SecA n=1 Tax=Acidaminobacter sp. JC074 TaxID=2530199 RepID=UPI001F0D029B|nr:preprotein translocase subunit SecA [Acidaminobacter sp. JC074]MCH4889275.1 preprotein translocase subunit SecA [Acidaminobacter sp. JC074]